MTFGMFPHQKHHQFRVHGYQIVIQAKRQCVLCAQFGVIATTAFGDVMEQGGNVEQPMTVKAAHQLIGHGQLFAVLGHGEAAQIAYDLQRVLVHGVGVKEVMLHLSDHAPENRQVAGKQIQ